MAPQAMDTKTNEYMSTVNNEAAVIHPNGKILLMNGNILECYPKAEAPVDIKPDAGLELDTTGEYLRIGKMPVRSPRKTGEEPWMRLFFKEAFFLYEHRDRILSDSRMFLTPLPFQNNLAYSGTSGLRHATLGVYLEWWASCERSLIKKDGDVHALTYYFAGSPLSGSHFHFALFPFSITFSLGTQKFGHIHLFPIFAVDTPATKLPIYKSRQSEFMAVICDGPDRNVKHKH